MKAGHAWHSALLAVDADNEEARTSVYGLHTWRRGAGLYVLGNALHFFSYAFAAQTLLLALGSIQFVTHLVATSVIEGASVPKRSMVAAAIIIAANALLIVFSSKSSDILTASELIALHRCAFACDSFDVLWQCCTKHELILLQADQMPRVNLFSARKSVVCLQQRTIPRLSDDLLRNCCDWRCHLCGAAPSAARPPQHVRTTGSADSARRQRIRACNSNSAFVEMRLNDDCEDAHWDRGFAASQLVFLASCSCASLHICALGFHAFSRSANVPVDCGRSGAASGAPRIGCGSLSVTRDICMRSNTGSEVQHVA